ncbi:MAG: tetratricopeptide repeat protein [Sphingomonas sp.]|nr:tetratricopeptide repeat protein [Sphingomonas sp.]
MTAQPSPARRFSAASLALGGAAILVVGALGYRLLAGGDGDAGPPEVNAAAVAAGSEAESIEDMIAALQERVRQDPDNHRDWFLLGLASRESGNHAAAEQAFRRAMELSPQDADYRAYLAEALLLRGGNSPPPEAEQLLRRVLELQPGNAQARYYLATIRDVRGDHRGAVDDLIALLNDAPEGAIWESQVRQAVTGIAVANNIDIEGRLPAPRQPVQSTATAAIPGPTRQDMEAARALTPTQQGEMAQDMVSRLEARLRQNPRDADGWIMLMRSRMVLNDRDAARAALQSGLAAFQGDAAAQQRLRTAGTELGVPNPS